VADKEKLRLFRLLLPAGEAQQQQHGSNSEAAAAAAAAGGGGAGSAPLPLQIQRVKILDQLKSPVVCCTFSSDSQQLYGVTGDGKIVAVDVTSGAITAAVDLATAADISSITSKLAKQQQQQQHQQLAPAAAAAPQDVWCGGLAPYMPRATLVAVSPNGQVLAVVTAAGIQLLSAAGLQRRHRVQLVGDPAAVTTVGFSPNSKFIAVATASNSVTAYSAETGMPTQWTLKNHGALAELLQHLPGSILGLSFRPTPAEPLSLLMHSAGGMCHVDLAAALPLYKPPEKAPRHKQNPALPQASALGEVGRNGRLLLLQHPCLLLGYLSATEALLLEKPWQDVLTQLMPPLYRHRYGS
jgi:hypothetical protein